MCESLKPTYAEYGNDLEGSGFVARTREKSSLADTKWNMSVRLFSLALAIFYAL